MMMKKGKRRDEMNAMQQLMNLPGGGNDTVNDELILNPYPKADDPLSDDELLLS